MQKALIGLHGGCQGSIVAKPDLLHRKWTRFPGDLLATRALPATLERVDDGILRDEMFRHESRSGSRYRNRCHEIPTGKFLG
jgi:hypothetical protein